MMIGLTGIQWASLYNLLFLPCIVLFCGMTYYKWHRTVKALSLLTAYVYVQQLVINYSSNRQLVKALLSSIGFLFLFLALLRPQWSEKERVIVQQGRDLFIALDISRSMLAQDVMPNRLECAKHKIRSILRNVTCERVGLILFSGSSFIQCPLTRDYSAFNMFLDQIDVETISSGTTAIDQAIYKAIQAFGEAQGRKHKLLIVLTDGEDFSQNLSNIKDDAHKAGLTIFSLGIGSKNGAPIPIFNNKGAPIGHQKDDSGAIVISRLNDTLLRSMTKETGGVYLDMTDNEDDISRLLSHVQKFEKEVFEDKKIASLEEQYPFFVVVSFICFALEWLL